MNYRYRSVRCRHGFDRSVVPCPACGDMTKLDLDERRRQERKAGSKRAQVISNPHGRPSNQRATVCK